MKHYNIITKITTNYLVMYTNFEIENYVLILQKSFDK